MEKTTIIDVQKKLALNALELDVEPEVQLEIVNVLSGARFAGLFAKDEGTKESVTKEKVARAQNPETKRAGRKTRGKKPIVESAQVKEAIVRALNGSGVSLTYVDIAERVGEEYKRVAQLCKELSEEGVINREKNGREAFLVSLNHAREAVQTGAGENERASRERSLLRLIKRGVESEEDLVTESGLKREGVLDALRRLERIQRTVKARSEEGVRWSLTGREETFRAMLVAALEEVPGLPTTIDELLMMEGFGGFTHTFLREEMNLLVDNTEVMRSADGKGWLVPLERAA